MYTKAFLLFPMFIIMIGLSACDFTSSPDRTRPSDPWVVRSVLDGRPRMLTLALDSNCFVAYDLEKCGLYKIWKGGVNWEGTVYTDAKNVQPTSWGADYYTDDLFEDIWFVALNGIKHSAQVIFKGYILKGQQIFFQYDLLIPEKGTIRLEERPEFIQNKTGQPGIERIFKTSALPENMSIFLKTTDGEIEINANSSNRFRTFFTALPAQSQPVQVPHYDDMGKYWMERSDCFTCHELEQQAVGPSFLQIAQRYPKEKKVIEQLVQRISDGGSGVWGRTIMNPHPLNTKRELRTMVNYILSLNPEETFEVEASRKEEKNQDEIRLKPGFGAALEGLHPSYELSAIRRQAFKPKVGGLAFLPDGRLLLSTWSPQGEVYLMEGVETGDTTQITLKRIASGLAEPLGIEVVDGEIFVLQKHELTQLIDLDGDDIIDEYRAICNSFGVTADFHEFAFGLVYKEGYFYANLSLAMRLLEHEKQLPDRGKTIKISRDGSFEWVNHGLRQPNGIGLGVDGEVFVTDNQGQWLPANKLIHVQAGDFHGMRWVLKDSLPDLKMTPPSVWLPQDEIANSPSEPILMKDGPYRGQMLHGDVTHGGIKRVFLEKINGAYQGAVFRFTQGLEAGVNRMRWGPDGGLYVGGVGMVGGWSWKEQRYGLQRMKYTGQPTFEMLAVRAKPLGIEIEFTEALALGQGTKATDYFIQQWWYLPTASYGGPKMDLEKMKISNISLSEDRKRVELNIPGLKKEHLVYIRLTDKLQSTSGQFLWSGEAWYTLNNIPTETIGNLSP